MNTPFICPVCRKPLIKTDGALSCGKHNFDISRKGYVNLLISNQKKSKNPGDNKQMIAARRRVLDSGYYSSLYFEIEKIVSPLSPDFILDLGCGEGSLTNLLAEKAKTCVGLDVSKEAINAASSKKGIYAVASAANIPLPDKSVDVLVNSFAPLYPDAERVLKDEGVVIKITPSTDHLFELKEAVYPNPYYNPPDKDVPPFRTVSSKVVKSRIILSNDLLSSVIAMTPYFYKTPKEDLAKVIDKEITTTLSFSVRILKK